MAFTWLPALRLVWARPYWDAERGARRALLGLTRDTGPAEISRPPPSMRCGANQTRGPGGPKAMRGDGAPDRRTQGSMAAWLVKRSADGSVWPTRWALQVERPKVIETTAPGGRPSWAGLAGRGFGPSLDALVGDLGARSGPFSAGPKPAPVGATKTLCPAGRTRVRAGSHVLIAAIHIADRGLGH